MGTGRLMGPTSLRESLSLLETAFDAGIRHFDTAPSYGLGQSERCLGEFLRRHRDEVTVTTKYGIPPPRNQALIAWARAVVRPMLKVVPGIKGRLAKAQRAISANPAGRKYSVDDARQTLDNSLRVLKVDRIDLWLLHEPCSDDLQNPDLLRFMEDAVAAGKIGAFGVGSELAKIPAIFSQRPEYCPVIQCEWDPLLRRERFAGHFTIFHTVFRKWRARLAEEFNQDRELCESWSNRTGVDLDVPGILDAVLLKAALTHNHGGIVLFFSRNRTNIAANANVASDPSLERPAEILLGLLRSREWE